MKKTNVKMSKPVYLGMPILDIGMNFGMITLNQSMKTGQNYVTQISK